MQNKFRWKKNQKQKKQSCENTATQITSQTQELIIDSKQTGEKTAIQKTTQTQEKTMENKLTSENTATQFSTFTEEQKMENLRKLLKSCQKRLDRVEAITEKSQELLDSTDIQIKLNDQQQNQVNLNLETRLANLNSRVKSIEDYFSDEQKQIFRSELYQNVCTIIENKYQEQNIYEIWRQQDEKNPKYQEIKEFLEKYNLKFSDMNYINFKKQQRNEKQPPNPDYLLKQKDETLKPISYGDQSHAIETYGKMFNLLEENKDFLKNIEA